MSARRLLPFAALVLLAATPAAAEDLTGADALLCWAAQVTACAPDFGCEEGTPAEWGVPQVLRIDLKSRVLRTTAASGVDRSSKAATVDRADGRILLAGYENGRAFSVLISESLGTLTATVTREDLGLTVFGGCTPLPVEGGAR